MDDERSKGSTEAQHQLDASKAKEAAPKAPDAQAAAVLQGIEAARTARVRTVEEIARGQEGADTDKDKDTDSDHENDTDTKTDFDKDQDALMTEFHLTDTGNAKGNFYLVAEKLAHEVQDKYGVPWQVCLAQACIESGYGHELGKAGREGYVIFGIKGTGYKGKVVESGTQEGSQGERREQAAFRGYASIRESFDGYGNFLKKSFPDAFQFKNDPALFAASLEANPHHMYAEDKEYLEKIKKFWKDKSVDAGVGVTAPSIVTQPNEEEKSWFTQSAEYISGLFGQVKGAFLGFLASLGFKWAEKKPEEAPPTDAPQAVPENASLLEYTNAPVFSFLKGANSRVSSAFGLRENPFKHGEIDDHAHAGVDISAPLGTPIYAMHEGVIVAPHSGSTETIRMADGREFTMRHLSQEGPAVGTVIHPGDLLGKVGNVGRSTGPHLHLEARVNGKLVDPIPYLGAEMQTQAQVVASNQKAKVDAIESGSRLT